MKIEKVKEAKAGFFQISQKQNKQKHKISDIKRAVLFHNSDSLIDGDGCHIPL